MSRAKTVLFKVSVHEDSYDTHYALVELTPVRAVDYASLIFKFDEMRKADSKDLHSVSYRDQSASFFEDKEDIVGTLDEAEELSDNGNAVLSAKSVRKLRKAIENDTLASHVRTDVERVVVKEDRLYFTAYDHYSNGCYDTYAIYLKDLKALSGV